MTKLSREQIDTPVGRLELAVADDKLCAPYFLRTPGKHLDNYLAKYFSDLEPGGDSPLIKTAVEQLNAYFKGDLREFNLPLDPRGTPFQQTVWQELLNIPYGEIRSYTDLANRLDLPGGMRAVGSANGRNPISIIIPCHRGVAAGGGLGGYTGGLDIKQKLLDLESRQLRLL